MCYPPAVARALVTMGEAAGVVVIHAAVARVSARTVALADGTLIEADAIVVAAGVASPVLVAGLPVVPRKGHLVITERQPGVVRHQLVELGYLKSAHTMSSSSVAFNLQPRRNGQLLIGSSRELVGFDSSINRQIVGAMMRRAIAMMPRIGSLRAWRTWTGFRPATLIVAADRALAGNPRSVDRHRTRGPRDHHGTWNRGVDHGRHHGRPVAGRCRPLRPLSGHAGGRGRSVTSDAAVSLLVDGVPRRVDAGITVAAALLRLGVDAFRRDGAGLPRAPLCGMGSCMECRVTVDGLGSCRACLIVVRNAMRIATVGCAIVLPNWRVSSARPAAGLRRRRRGSEGRVVLVDQAPRAGGQIWRHRDETALPRRAQGLLARARAAGVSMVAGAPLLDAQAPHRLIVDFNGRVDVVEAGAVIIATGARERFLPFPGWPLPGVAAFGGCRRC